MTAASLRPLGISAATVHPLTLSGATPEGRGEVEGPAGASTPGSLREPSAQHERGAERLLAALSAFVLLLLGATPPARALDLELRTGPSGGAYDRIGRALADEVRRRLHDVALAPTSTSGSLENVAALARGDGLAIVQADVLRDAYQGEGRFDRAAPGLRALAVLFPETLHVLARPGLDLAAVADVRGRRVSLGAPGSGTLHTARRLLAAAGLGMTDITALRLGDDEGVPALLGGNIDVLITVAALPSASVARALAGGARLVPLDAPLAARFGDNAYPLIVSAIPPGTYAGQDAAVPALVLHAVLAASEEVSRGAVEDVVEALFAGLDALRAAHPAARAIELARAAKPAPVPIHKGATLFYGRKGGPLEGPIAFTVMVFVYDVGDIDLQTGTFAFDCSVELRWNDPRITPADAPFFEVVNSVDMQPESYGFETWGDGQSLTTRVRGRARSAFTLERYPFDRQRLEFSLEHRTAADDKVIWVPETALDPSVDLQRDRLVNGYRVEDWALEEITATARPIPYGPDVNYSRYTFAIGVRRHLLQFVIKDLAPLALMVLLALVGGLLPADKLDGKLVLTVLALLVAVELQLSHLEHMPKVGHLTLGEWMYLLAYISIAVGVVQTIVEYRLHAAGRDDLARRASRVGMALSVAVFVLPLAFMAARRM